MYELFIVYILLPMNREEQLKQAEIEALIFTSENGITLDELRQFFFIAPDDNGNEALLNTLIEAINDKYSKDDFGFELQNMGNRYVFLSKKKYHPSIQKIQTQHQQKTLSQAAIETLAIIAYKQPCHKSDIEAIRGVNCDYSLDKLLERNLVLITGQSDAPGKPLIYETSPLFMNYLGINSLQDLPAIKELIGQNGMSEE